MAFKRDDLLTAVAILLVLFCTLPTWIGFIALVSGKLTAGKDFWASQLFFELIFSPDQLLDFARAGLIGVIAALPVARGESVFSRNNVMFLSTIFICFAALFALWMALGMFTTGETLAGNINYRFMEEATPNARYSDANNSVDGWQFERGWRGYLMVQAQMLAAQAALFLGIQAKESK